MQRFYRTSCNCVVSLLWVAVFGITAFYLSAAPVLGQNWYRGEMHSHTFWSDGAAFPEDAVKWYQDRGYHFLCLSDHRILQVDTDKWVSVGNPGKLTAAFLKDYTTRYRDAAEIKTDGDKVQVRLKTIGELKKMFDVSEKFLLIPSLELTGQVDKRELHMNAIHIVDTIPYQKTEDTTESIALNHKAVEQHGKDKGQPTLFMLNHPLWRWYDVLPESLIKNPDVRFYELNNGGLVFGAHDKFFSRDQYWDIVNSFRLSENNQVVFGVGTDDRHGYPQAGPNNAWVVVNAPELTSVALLKALNDGKFYTSSGVEMDKVEFDSTTGTLTVAVKPEPDATYTVEFIGTKKNFDKTVTPFEIPAEGDRPARRGATYSDDIGIVFKTSERTQAKYTLKPDDLYVRAKITKTSSTKPQKEAAWTQPVTGNDSVH